MDIRVSRILFRIALAIPVLGVAVDGVRAENGNPPGYDCAMHHNGYLMHRKPGCMTGGVSGTVSRIEAPAQPKIGTYSPSPGIEFGVVVGADWITRYGFETEFERTIDGPDWSLNGFSSSFYINTKFIWARDEYGFSGSRTNNSTSQLSGVTVNSTGSFFGIGSIDGGIVGNGSATNSWHIGSIGAGMNIIPDEERPNHSFALEVRPFWERIKYDSDGYAEVQQNGSLWNNTYQRYNYDSSDNYYGASFEARAYMTPHWCDFVVLDVGGHLDLAYHEGKGNFWQLTNSGSSQITESENYDRSGFTVGGGISGGATIKVPERLGVGRWTLRAELDYSVLPDVTSFNFRGAPNDPAGTFTQKDLERVTATFGARIQF